MPEEELELDLDLEENKVERRIKQLSEKVKLTAQERDELAKAKEDALAEKDSVSKERDFYKGFSQVASKHSAAAEYQDKIWEKVKQGYEIEDATISVLAKEGKYSAPAVPQAPVERENPTGGSAATALTGGGQKSIGEMNREELRAALLDADSRGEFRNF